MPNSKTKPWAVQAIIMYEEEINEMLTSQKWIEPFRDLLDQVFFPGYAETLEKENPEEFNHQYFYFLAQYS